jgi:hypothetical protein
MTLLGRRATCRFQWGADDSEFASGVCQQRQHAGKTVRRGVVAGCSDRNDILCAAILSL